MFADRRWVFMTASIVAIVAIVGALIYMRDKNPSKFLITSLSFFLGGGIGNMIDRFRLKYVIDFLHFDFFEFPIFNVADSFISVGAGLMILYLILDTIKEEKEKRLKKTRNENV